MAGETKKKHERRKIKKLLDRTRDNKAIKMAIRGQPADVNPQLGQIHLNTVRGACLFSLSVLFLAIFYVYSQTRDRTIIWRMGSHAHITH